MNFKQWMLGEMATFALNMPIHVYEADNANGPFHVGAYKASYIDMRFEDYSIEGQRPPQGNWAAPLADGKFIVFNNATHKATVGDQPAIVGPNGQPQQVQVIRQDWARFAEIYDGNTVVKAAQYDRGPTGNAGQYKPQSSLIPISNPAQPAQNPSRLQSA